MSRKGPAFKNTMPPLRRGALDTNIEAAKRLFPKTGEYKHRLVTAHLNSDDGLTDHEAAKRLGRGVAWSTAGATRHALNHEFGFDWFANSGDRRANDAGNRCTVWVLTKDARRYLRSA